MRVAKQVWRKVKILVLNDDIAAAAATTVLMLRECVRGGKI